MRYPVSCTKCLAALACVCLAGILPGATHTATPAADTAAGDTEMKLTSTAFREGDVIPKKHTGEGSDVSPPLAWTDPPANTHAFALICDDPDAPAGTWVHWVIYNVGAATLSLPENVPKIDESPEGVRQGKNDFGKIGYNGPMPPPGRAHRYVFKLYALDVTLNLRAGARKADVEKAMQGHILGEAKLMGTYKR